MKSLKICFATVLFTVCLLSCSPASGANSLSKWEATSVVARWFDAAEQVAGNSAKARSILDFLHENSDVITTAEFDAYPSGRLGILVLTSADRRDQRWGRLYDSNFIARYRRTQGKSFIILKDGPLPFTLKGLILIHEGDHALQDHLKTFAEIEDVNIKKAMFELSAYSVEIELAEKIGGEQYRKSLENEMARLKGSYLKTGRVIGPDLDLYTETLTRTFGSAPRNIDVDTGATFFWINSVFKMIDYVSWNDTEAQKRKIDFIVETYKKYAAS